LGKSSIGIKHAKRESSLFDCAGTRRLIAEGEPPTSAPNLQHRSDYLSLLQLPIYNTDQIT